MKRFMLLVGVAVVAAAMYVAASPASQQASGPSAKQFAALKKQVASLSKSLKQVKAAANDADGFVRTCLISTNSGVLPINRFGDPAGTFGYQYFDGANTIDTTALDLDHVNALPGRLSPGCRPDLRHGRRASPPGALGRTPVPAGRAHSLSPGSGGRP